MPHTKTKYFPGVVVRDGSAVPLRGADTSIIIPTAGQGRRMRSYGPKALVELGQGQTVLSRLLLMTRKALPGGETTVVLGFEADRIYRTLPPGVRSVENEYHETTNVIRSLDLALRASPRPQALIVYGDLVFNSAALADHTWTESFAVVDSNEQMAQEEVGATVVDGKVTQFAYDLPVKWAQIVFLAAPELTLFRRLAADPTKRRCFGFEVLNDVLDRGGCIKAVEPEGLRLAEIDSAKDVEKAVKIAAGGR